MTIDNVQVWSHAETEYMIPTDVRFKKQPRKYTYQRITVAAVYNNSENTLFGVSVQSVDDINDKKTGQEYAVQNALIRPVMELHSKAPLTDRQFNIMAEALYETYVDNVRVVKEENCSWDEALYNGSLDIIDEEPCECDSDGSCLGCCPCCM